MSHHLDTRLPLFLPLSAKPLMADSFKVDNRCLGSELIFAGIPISKIYNFVVFINFSDAYYIFFNVGWIYIIYVSFSFCFTLGFASIHLSCFFLFPIYFLDTFSYMRSRISPLGWVKLTVSSHRGSVLSNVVKAIHVFR